MSAVSNLPPRPNQPRADTIADGSQDDRGVKDSVINSYNPSGALSDPEQVSVDYRTESNDDVETGIPSQKPTLPQPEDTNTDCGSIVLTLQNFSLSTVNMQNFSYVMIELNAQMRKAAKEDRAAARDLNVSLQYEAADKIRSQAAFTLAATVVSATVSIAGAAGNIKMQARSLKLQKATLDMDPAKQAPQISLNNAKATNLSQIGNAFQALGTSIGQLLGAPLNLLASQEEADKAELTAEAEKAKTAADDETDFIKAYEEVMRKVLEVLQSIQQAAANTERTIVSG